MKKVRASSIPLLVLCPASAGDGLHIDYADEVGEQSTEIHRNIALSLRGKEVPELDAESEEMVQLALEWARAKAEKDENAQPRYEVHLEDSVCDGTIDVLSIGGTTAWLADWKATYREGNHWPQVQRYAALVFAAYPMVQAIELNVVFLRKEGVDTKIVTRSWIESWWEETRRNCLDHPEIYRVGAHCERCPRRTYCPALLVTKREVAMILANGADVPLVLSREQMAKLRPAVKLIEGVIKQYNEQIRQDVIANGPLDTSDGKQLRAIEITTQRIGLRNSLELLQARFTDAEIDTFVRVGKTNLMKAVGDKAAKGMKSKDQEKLLAQLKAVGAVTETKETQVREVAKR